MSMSWTCPYCNKIATITESNLSVNTHEFHKNNRHDAALHFVTAVTVTCPRFLTQ